MVIGKDMQVFDEITMNKDDRIYNSWVVFIRTLHCFFLSFKTFSTYLALIKVSLSKGTRNWCIWKKELTLTENWWYMINFAQNYDKQWKVPTAVESYLRCEKWKLSNVGKTFHHDESFPPRQKTFFEDSFRIHHFYRNYFIMYVNSLSFMP